MCLKQTKLGKVVHFKKLQVCLLFKQALYFCLVYTHRVFLF